jgi:hypothetical protein
MLLAAQIVLRSQPNHCSGEAVAAGSGAPARRPKLPRRLPGRSACFGDCNGKRPPTVVHELSPNLGDGRGQTAAV